MELGLAEPPDKDQQCSGWDQMKLDKAIGLLRRATQDRINQLEHIASSKCPEVQADIQRNINRLKEARYVAAEFLKLNNGN